MKVAKQIENLKQDDITEDVSKKPTAWFNTQLL